MSIVSLHKPKTLIVSNTIAKVNHLRILFKGFMQFDFNFNF